MSAPDTGQTLDRLVAQVSALKDALLWLRNETKCTPWHLTSPSLLRALGNADAVLESGDETT